MVRGCKVLLNIVEQSIFIKTKTIAFAFGPVTLRPNLYFSLYNPYHALSFIFNVNPGMVAPPLDGSNYHTWSHIMKHALHSKNKIKFFNSGIQESVKTDVLHDV